MRLRRAFFAALTLVLALALVDGAAHLILIASGTRMSDVREARGALAKSKSHPDPEGRITQKGLDTRNPIVLHPYLGFVYSTLSEDDQGLLGPDPLDADESSYNVAITGGSVAANFFRDVATTLGDEITGSHAAGGRPVRVYNLAVGGWHQPQQSMALSYFSSLGVPFDLVINIDGFNEVAVATGQAGSYSILYPRAWPQLTANLSAESQRILFGEIALIRRARGTWARWSATAPLSWSAVTAVVWRSVDGFLQQAGTRRQGTLERELTELAPFQRGYGRVLVAGDAIDFLADLWVEASAAMNALQRGLGRAYLHVLQPNQYVPDSKPLSEQEQREAYRPEAPYAQWATLGYAELQGHAVELEARGVEIFDATGVFDGIEETLYIDECCHVNGRGNEILLRETLAFIRERGLLERQAGSHPEIRRAARPSQIP